MADYGWLMGGTVTVAAASDDYTITKCVFIQNDKTPLEDDKAPFTATIDNYNGYVYAETSTGQVQKNMDGITSIEVYGYKKATGPEVAWDKAAKTGSFKMPGGNVTLEPDYYPQATLAFQGLTAAVDAAAKTEAPLAVVADGAVTGDTLMYYVATDKNFSQADAIALAETQWSADIPTAETIEAAGTYIMWYYIKVDAEHSDTDPIPLVVTLLPAPTYAVTFAEGTDPNEWTASPNTDVTKGQTVTVTYSGSKKVIGVKAEKKAKTLSVTIKGRTIIFVAGDSWEDALKYPENKNLTIYNGKVQVSGYRVYDGNNPVQPSETIDASKTYSGIME